MCIMVLLHRDLPGERETAFLLKATSSVPVLPFVSHRFALPDPVRGFMQVRLHILDKYLDQMHKTKRQGNVKKRIDIVKTNAPHSARGRGDCMVGKPA